MNRVRAFGTATSVLIPLLLGAMIIFFLGYNPLEAYLELFKGAFIGRLSFGTTLEKFVPILLTGLAYCLTIKVGYFNLGVEGSLYMGALFAAAPGFMLTGLPPAIHIPICLITGIVAGALWASVPGTLKSFFNVNEICVALLFNYVAILLTSFMLNYVWSAKTAAPQTPPLQPSALLYNFLRPSRANLGLVVALLVFFIIYFMLFRTSVGYRIKSVGNNPLFSDYVGISSKWVVLSTVLISGGIGGLAGSIETMGLYGRTIDEFSVGTAFDGLLASQMSRNNLKSFPIYAFLFAALKAGALGMERFTGVPKALVDVIIALFILMVAIEKIFSIYHFKPFGRTLLNRGGKHV